MPPRVLLAILASSAGWGLAAVGTRALFIWGATTFTVIVGRTLIATVALLLFGAAFRRRIRPPAWRDGALIGVVRIGLTPMLFIASLQFISAGVEALIITLVPVVTAFAAWIFLGESLHRRQVVGLVFGLAGTALLVSSGDSGIGDGSGNIVVGAALAFGGVLAAAISGTMSRHFAPRYDTTELSIPMFLAGAMTVLVVGLGLRDIQPSSLTGTGWLLLGGLGLASTLLPFVGTLYASRYTSAARVSLTAYLAPFITVIAGWLLLDERITVAMVVGGALTIAGVAIATRSPDREPASDRTPSR